MSRTAFAPAGDGGMVMSILRALQANGPMHRDCLGRRLQFEATMLARGSVIATLIRLEREGRFARLRSVKGQNFASSFV